MSTVPRTQVGQLNENSNLVLNTQDIPRLTCQDGIHILKKTGTLLVLGSIAFFTSITAYQALSEGRVTAADLSLIADLSSFFS